MFGKIVGSDPVAHHVHDMAPLDLCQPILIVVTYWNTNYDDATTSNSFARNETADVTDKELYGTEDLFVIKRLMWIFQNKANFSVN
eukprot:7474933-Ditylum_brightwellii.AAC.1